MITSVQNPLIKQLRQLGESSKHRQKQQQMLLEGTHLLQEAIATNYPLTIVCHTEKWQAREKELYSRMLSLSCEMELVADHVLSAVATTLQPDGVIASAPLPKPKQLQIRHLGMALEGIQDPGNMGTILRGGAAAGCDGFIISENCVDLTNPKILRATSGQWFRSVLKPVDNLVTELLWWQSRGIKIVGTSAQADVLLWQYDFSQPSLVVLGNEGRGLSSEVLDLIDGCLAIPVNPGVESLNVAMTATLILFEAKRQSMGGALLMP